MDLFEVVNNIAMPSVHALLIEPFKSLWEKDATKDKTDAIRAFTFIELMCSPKKSNPYMGYSKDIRYSKLAEAIYKDALARPTNDIQVEEGMAIYLEMLENSSPALSALEDALKALEKTKEMLRNVDYSERTNGGAAVTKPAEILRAVAQMPDVVKSIQTLREKVQADLMETSKTRGSREVGAFER